MKKLIIIVISRNHSVDWRNYTVVSLINTDDLEMDEEIYPIPSNSTSNISVEQAGIPAQAFVPYPIS